MPFDTSLFDFQYINKCYVLNDKNMHKLEFSKAVYLKTDNDRRKIDTTLSTTREFRESCSLDKS